MLCDHCVRLYHTQTNTMVTKLIGSGQNQLKYTYQLQQGDKTHHTKHTTTHRKVTLMLKHPSLQNKTTDVVIYQHSRKLLKIGILMSETCWAHNKWNKIASDIKLVFHSSIILHYFYSLFFFYFVSYFSYLNGYVGWSLCSKLWAWKALPLNTSMYAKTNRCYNERGSRTNCVRSSIPHCTGIT